MHERADKEEPVTKKPSLFIAKVFGTDITDTANTISLDTILHYLAL